VELTFYGISSGNPRRANGTRQEASNDNDRFATNYARTQWWCPRYRPRPPLGERMIADSGERSGDVVYRARPLVSRSRRVRARAGERPSRQEGLRRSGALEIKKRKEREGRRDDNLPGGAH